MIFVSRFANHKFVLTGTRVIRDREGFPTGDVVLGKQIEFNGHRCATEDPDEIAFLLKQLGPDVAVLENPNELSPLERPAVPVGEALSSANTVDRQIRCEVCGRAFRTRQNLNMHMKTHAGVPVPAAEGAPAAEAGG